MNDLIDSVSNITNILTLCLSISILPVIITRIVVKITKLFIGFVEGNKRVRL